jgi:YidC/Oxa1 family membrane protein insertase
MLAFLFGAPLGAYLRMPAEQLAAYGVDRWQVAAVTIPLAALAALATYLTSRHALRRTPPGDPLTTR